MKAYEIHCVRVREYIENKKKNGMQVKEIQCPGDVGALVSGLPVGIGKEQSKIILKEDTFVELGNPSVAASAFVVWSDDLSRINDGRITLIGPDVPEAEGQNLPFGQVILVGGKKLTEEHYLDLEKTQYTTNQIEGYMLRSVPRKVWSRVGREAAQKGFSFETLGRTLMAVFKQSNDLIQAAEVLFVTSNKKDVEALDEIGIDVRKFSGELKKLQRQDDGTYECIDYNCDTCDFQKVCEDIRKVITVRREQNKKAQKAV